MQRLILNTKETEIRFHKLNILPLKTEDAWQQLTVVQPSVGVPHYGDDLDGGVVKADAVEPGMFNVSLVYVIDLYPECVHVHAEDDAKREKKRYE